MDNVRENIKAQGMDIRKAKDKARVRSTWRLLVRPSLIVGERLTEEKAGKLDTHADTTRWREIEKDRERGRHTHTGTDSLIDRQTSDERRCSLVKSITMTMVLFIMLMLMLVMV